MYYRDGPSNYKKGAMSLCSEFSSRKRSCVPCGFPSDTTNKINNAIILNYIILYYIVLYYTINDNIIGITIDLLSVLCLKRNFSLTQVERVVPFFLKLESSYQNPGSVRNLLKVSLVSNRANLHSSLRSKSMVSPPAVGCA